MAIPEHLAGKDAAAMEEWFLGALDADPAPAVDIVSVLEALDASGEREKAREWAELAQESLVDSGERPAVLRLLALYASWHGDDAGSRKACGDLALRAFDDRVGRAFVESVDFWGKTALAECVRRLAVLAGLEEGAFCIDKTWGFGVVQRVDDFYKKVAIDFTRKPGHEMSMAYAGEALERVGPEHLMVVRHTQPEELRRLVDEQPGDVVRSVLRDFGPMTAPDLQEFAVAEILGDRAWKGFWDQARRALKNDPLVEIPVKRSEPIRLLASAKAYGAEWVSALQGERDPVAIVALVEELVGAVSSPDADQRRAVVDRLTFAMRAVEGKQPDRLARLALLAARHGFDEGEGGLDPALATRHLGEPETFLAACEKLPLRDVEALVDHLGQHSPDGLSAMLPSLALRLPAHAIGAAVRAMTAAGGQEALASVVRDAFAARSVALAMLHYLGGALDLVEAWQLGTTADYVTNVMVAMDSRSAAGRPKDRKLLAARFDDARWLEGLLQKMDARERMQFMTRVKTCRGWDESTRRSVMAKMIKSHPELQEVLSGGGEGEVRKSRFTSWRSYRERQEQLRVLVEVTIPQNSKDIGHARSYGDLRENFEYQAARDQQNLLMRRRAELERDLGEVRGTDFSEVHGESAGMGTGVDVERPGGAAERYWILGEWDRDENLGIISSRSELAQCLEGCRPGDAVRLPGDGGDATSRLVTVLPLDEELKNWVAAQAGAKDGEQEPVSHE